MKRKAVPTPRRQTFGLVAAFLPLPAALAALPFAELPLAELPLPELPFAELPLAGLATVPPFDAASIRADRRDLIRAALLR